MASLFKSNFHHFYMLFLQSEYMYSFPLLAGIEEEHISFFLISVTALLFLFIFYLPSIFFFFFFFPESRVG